MIKNDIILYMLLFQLYLANVVILPRSVQLWNDKNQVERSVDFELHLNDLDLQLNKPGGRLYIRYSDRNHKNKWIQWWHMSDLIIQKHLKEGEPFRFTVGAQQGIKFKFGIEPFTLEAKYKNKKEMIYLGTFTDYFANLALDLAPEKFQFEYFKYQNPFTLKELRRIRKGLYIFQKINPEFVPQTPMPRHIHGWSSQSELKLFLKEVYNRIDEIQENGITHISSPNCIQLYLGDQKFDHPKRVYKFFGKVLRRVGFVVGYLGSIATLAGGFVLFMTGGIGLIAFPFIMLIFLSFTYLFPIGACMRKIGSMLIDKNVGGEAYYKLKEDLQFKNLPFYRNMV